MIIFLGRMRIKFLFACFLCLCSSAGISQSQINLSIYKRYTKSNGLSDNSIKALHQDKHGFLWIGTDNGGLNRFDGKKFIHFLNDPSDSSSISGNSVTSISSDDQNVWLATQNSGISRYNLQTGRFYQYTLHEGDSTKLSMDNMFVVKARGNNEILAGNWKGMDKYDPDLDLFEEVIFPDHEDSWYFNGIRQVEQRDDCKLLLGSEGNGLMLYDFENDSIIKYTDHLDPEDINKWTQPVISIAIDNTNDLIWTITNIKESYIIFSHQKSNPSEFKQHLYINENDLNCKLPLKPDHLNLWKC